MSRYWYSLVRCVPDPRTGEFVNVGAIAGSPDAGEWSVRQVGNTSRARRLADPRDLEVVSGFMARVGTEIDRRSWLMDQGGAEPLDETWLRDLFHNHRNVVQLSPPAPIVADNADHALQLVFEQMVIDPVSQPRAGGVTKHRIIADIRDAYRHAAVDISLLKRAEIRVGEHVHAPVDFAVGNGATVQLTQGWSFQRAGLDELSLQVKAWGYALRLLRDGQSARVVAVDGSGEPSTVDSEVDVEVVVALPLTTDQTDAYEEATQVFTELRARVHDIGGVGAVGQRAAELLIGHNGFPRSMPRPDGPSQLW